jgi:hypothetical protein
MVTENHPGNQQHHQADNRRAYIDEVPLRLLARMIARDILQGRPFLTTLNRSVDSNILPEMPITKKEAKS